MLNDKPMAKLDAVMQHQYTTRSLTRYIVTSVLIVPYK